MTKERVVNSQGLPVTQAEYDAMVTSIGRLSDQVERLRAALDEQSAIPCNQPFERVPQHEADPGFGPVPPRPKVTQLHQSPAEPNGDDPWVMDVAGVSVELKEWEPGAVRRPAVKGAAPPLPEPRRMHDDRQREVCVFWPEEWERIRAALNRGAEP
jgi:hypothetical protein